MTLRLSPRAIADVDRIYLASARRFGIRQADIYQRGLRDTLDAIAAFPQLAHERQDPRRKVRIQPYESHLVIYLIEEDGVLVVRIVHAHQNLRRIL